VTLIELLVTLALLAILAGVVGLTLHTTPHVPVLDSLAAQVLVARDVALRTGRSVTISLAHDGQVLDATALPDGRVVAAPSLAIDPLTGTGAHAAR
jgi:prepilin-type N-terminal cleavage/methylation domain-containing protein